jgi:outer membrane protein OmpA-like peptidoglycan-associated protein
LPVLLACLLSVAPAAAWSAEAPAASTAVRPPPRAVRLELTRGEVLLRAQMARLPEGSEVVLVREPDRLVLRVPASLLFAPDTVELRSGHDVATVVAVIAQPLKRRPRLGAQVLVYTDSIGGSSFNDAASTARAQAVAAALLSQGVPSTRFEARGAGAGGALASNDTPAGRIRNRRVEIVFEYAKPLRPVPAVGHAGG